jgi:uncharacterized protein YqeY
MLYEQLEKRYKLGMINNERRIVSYIRSIKAKIEEYVIANGLKKDDRSDEVVERVLRSYKKSLEKGVKQLEIGGDKSIHIVNEYNDEIDFCGKFLPDDTDNLVMIENIVRETLEEMSGIVKIGSVIGKIMKDYDNLDGKLVREAIISYVKTRSIKKE